MLLFSYKSQVDDNGEEESVTLPHQNSFSSLKGDSDYIYQVLLEHLPVHVGIHQVVSMLYTLRTS